MTYYIYFIERTTENNTVRELIAVDNLIKIKGYEVNETNTFGVKLKGERTEAITYLTKVVKNNIEELKEEFKALCNKKGYSLKYCYNNKKYLILPAVQEKKGVYKDNDLIIHQIGYPYLPKENEVMFLGNINKDKETDITEFKTYYSNWKEKSIRALKRGKPYQQAILIGFLLAYNQYLWENSYERPTIKLVKIGITYTTIIKYNALIKDFYSRVKETLSGAAQEVLINDTAYTYLNSEELLLKYYQYIEDFWEYFLSNK